MNVALSASGMQKLGLRPEILGLFSLELQEGMATPHRSRLFDDAGESAPEHWAWGGPATPPIDVLLMLFTRDAPTLAEAYDVHRRRARDGGLREITRLDTSDLGFKEHFGFRDGISQPAIEGYLDWPRRCTRSRRGEFVLGDPNQHGQYTERPTLYASLDPEHLLPGDPSGSGQVDLGRNGSYLVFRQLSQDVRGFWQFMDRATRNADDGSDEAARVRLAAKIVGRWPGGAPLALSPERDDPELATANDFGYEGGDPYGFGCPIGAHVRLANPRDSLEPDPVTQTIASTGHRIIRRGREFGRTSIAPEVLFEPPPLTMAKTAACSSSASCGNIAAAVRVHPAHVDHQSRRSTACTTIAIR